MAFWTDFLWAFPHTISVRAWVSEDSGGNVTYAAPVTYRAHIKDEVKSWKWEDGNELQSRRTIYTTGNIGKKDEITLPAGFEPRVIFPMHVIRRYDETFHHSELYT